MCLLRHSARDLTHLLVQRVVMASAFVGLTVVVKLKAPRGWLLRGLVTNVQDQRLFLDNGMSLLAQA